MEIMIADLFSRVEPNAVMVFGMFLMFGVCGGVLAHRVKWLPTITAFMLLGLIVGPNGLGLITKTMLADSSVLIDLALGMILYKLGNMLHPKAMVRSRKMLAQSFAESSLSFIFVFILVVALGSDAVLAAFIGAIAVSSSPAVLVHMAEEMEAKGPVTERAKSLVAMNNLFSFLIFSMALPFAMFAEKSDMLTVLVTPLYRLVGAVVIGIVVGWIAVRISGMLHKREEHYRFAIVIGAVSVVLGVSEMLHTSALFAPLILGIAMRWFETSKSNLSRVCLGEGGDLFYIVLFVMAGAKIDPSALIAMGLIPVLLVIVRSCGKFAGIFIVSPYTGFDKKQSGAVSLLLIPMAGMAIGLAATTANLAPEIGVTVTTIVFATVALFETIGPFMAAYAFRMVGEANEEDEEDQPQGKKTSDGSSKPAVAGPK